MRFAYIYVMSDSPRVPIVASAHAEYWRSLALRDYEGGPFADRSGGLIVFDADSLRAARQYVVADPFVEDNLLSSRSLKQGVPETAAKEVVA